MRKTLHYAFLPVTAAMMWSTAIAQDRFAFAITDVTKEGVNWTALRKIDFRTGQYSDVLLNGAEAQTPAFDAVSRRQLDLRPDAQWGSLLNQPFGNGVAAAAYDRDHNRLYFTPMFVDQLRYIDLKTMRVYYVTGQKLTGHGDMHNNEGQIVTRMVIAPDGYGYAITNDGNSLIRFSTGKKTATVEQLGGLIDNPANAGISIHNRCGSFGGDMVCDDEGNLFILTAFNNVFRVNVQSRIATHIAAMTGLPEGFTTNGAVVDADGKILVSSASRGESYFSVDPKTWAATPASIPNVYKSSDLANGNYISTRQRADVPLMTRLEEKFSKLISVYPNPVTVNKITVQFNQVPRGEYTVELTDVVGRSVMQRKLQVEAENQTQVLPLSESFSKGVYMIKVFDGGKQSVFTQKIVVQ